MTGTPPTEAEILMQQGIAALKAGDTSKASEQLARSLQLNPRNEQAWLWLSGAVATDAHRRYCLQRVLDLNPNNAAAQLGLQRLSGAPIPPSPAPNLQHPPAPQQPERHGLTQAPTPTIPQSASAPPESTDVSAAAPAARVEWQARQPAPELPAAPPTNAWQQEHTSATKHDPQPSADVLIQPPQSTEVFKPAQFLETVPSSPATWATPTAKPHTSEATGTTTNLNRFNQPAETLADVLGLSIPATPPPHNAQHAAAPTIATAQALGPAEPSHTAATAAQESISTGQIVQVVILIVLLASIAFLFYEAVLLLRT